MMKHIAIISVGLLIVCGLLTFTFTYQVDESKDVVLIEQFGKVTRVLEGGQDGQSGLKLKWPWPIQKVIRYDSRTSMLESAYTQLSTGDNQSVDMTTFCVWKIDDPEKFHKSIREDDPARRVVAISKGLRSKLVGHMGDVMSKRPMAVLINPDPDRMKLDEIEREIRDLLDGDAREAYGVKIVRVGIKRLGLPEGVTEKVIVAMQKERAAEVTYHESSGRAEADAIVARAQAARDQILAFADRKAKEIRTEGDRGAAEYYKDFEEDPQFAIFLRSLTSLKKELAGQAIIILDGSKVPAMKWLKDGPTVGETKTSN